MTFSSQYLIGKFNFVAVAGLFGLLASCGGSPDNSSAAPQSIQSHDVQNSTVGQSLPAAPQTAGVWGTTAGGPETTGTGGASASMTTPSFTTAPSFTTNPSFTTAPSFSALPS